MRLALASLAVLAVALLLFAVPPLAQRQSASVDSMPATSAPMKTEHSDGVRNGGAESLPRTGARLPPPNAPLREIQASLRAAAAQGDETAGCRLAMELLRCVQYNRDLRMTGQIDALRKRGVLQQAAGEANAKLSAVQRRIEANAPVCAGVSTESGAEPWRLLLEGARAGHVPSMINFATAPLTYDRNEEWSADALAAYRTFALPFLTTAAAAGNAAAIEKLGFEYLAPGAGTRAVPFDPVRGLAYLKALSALESRGGLRQRAEAAAKAANMTVEQVAEADVLSSTILPSSAVQNLGHRSEASASPLNHFGCLGDGAVR